jgi:hypothetical protein
MVKRAIGTNTRNYSRILPQFHVAFAAMQQTPRSVAMCLILFWGVAGWLHAQAAPSAPTPVAGNFKTLDGKEYKNATVSRAEPDGLVLTTKLGISKVYFVELPKEVQERFHYDAAKAAQFTTAEQAAVAQSNAAAQAAAVQRQQESRERQRQIALAIEQQRQAEQQQQAEIERQEQASARQQQAELQRAQTAKRIAAQNRQDANRRAAQQQQALQRQRALQQDPDKADKQQKPTETALDYLERRAAQWNNTYPIVPPP